MRQQSCNGDNGPLRGLYRDRENGWLFGVCAGLADRFNLNLAGVRLVAVISLLFFFWATVLIYFAAAFLIREKPLIYCGRDNEYEFWRRRGSHWRHS